MIAKSDALLLEEIRKRLNFYEKMMKTWYKRKHPYYDKAQEYYAQVRALHRQVPPDYFMFQICEFMNVRYMFEKICGRTINWQHTRLPFVYEITPAPKRKKKRL